MPPHVLPKFRSCFPFLLLSFTFILSTISQESAHDIISTKDTLGDNENKETARARARENLCLHTPRHLLFVSLVALQSVKDIRRHGHQYFLKCPVGIRNVKYSVSFALYSTSFCWKLEHVLKVGADV